MVLRANKVETIQLAGLKLTEIEEDNKQRKDVFLPLSSLRSYSSHNCQLYSLSRVSSVHY